MTVKKLLIASSLLAIAACSQQPSNEKLLKALKTTQSWVATAQMVGEGWQRGAIPDSYAQQTLEKSQQEIGKETKDLAIPSSLQQQLSKLQATLQKLTADIKQHHKTEISASLQELSKQRQQISSFVKEQGAQP